MIAPVKPATSLSPETLQHQFADHILPAAQLHAAVRFRHLKGQDRDDAIQETQAVAWQLFIQASESCKDPATFPTYVAAFAVKRVRSGRLLAGTSTHEVLSPAVQQRNAFEVHSLDDESCDLDTGWKAAVAQDSKHATPADTVAFRLDFDRWLDGLPSRDRSIGEALLVGDRPGLVATRFGVSPSMISKLRRRLALSWERFQNAVPFRLRGAEVLA